MAKVESFTLDHTKVKAPYVRLIAVEEGPKGDKISNYDLRLVQPNENAIPTGGLHLIMWGEPSTTEVAKALKSSLEEIRDDITWEDVPGTTIKTCGNYRDHSLFSARQWCHDILEKGISDDPFNRNVI
ncbi:S-ribosylhomocysteine lyase [Lactobacillus hamsteri]|uniref:S-ribosylhomocysteine lyase n=1 Tax=Lactobacillus hamsteri DSM 5661 = JCM 6256 TaxID=1423754 RepID=A0A0R1YEF4_9LACO|nr:S-ribosylhomocysteine lyase [Lactobacillus hamsteri]KRM40389.1 S-ribosylhomocysteinase [Lactobacillus hamsteri DSM 5661 = JCM 6256]